MTDPTPRPPAWLAGAAACLLAGAVQAAEPAGLRFEHKDWELACDNTRTCRAAGYHAEGGGMALSVLLTRQAGPRQPVKAELVLGTYEDEDLWKQLPASFALAMSVDGRSLGTVTVRAQQPSAELSAVQAAALVAALPQARAVVEWSYGRHRWRLSDQGATAVLLKMDEFQGRLGTPGALVRKGTSPETAVLPALPAPVVAAAAPVPTRPGDAALARKPPPALLQSLRRALEQADDCTELDGVGSEDRPLAVQRLSATRLLVSGLCWTAAYNTGNGYWVVDDRPPYAAALVTVSGGEYADGRITAAQKGRGLGDCWASDEWVWDGRRFAHVASSTTGLCRLVAPGGPWSLPTLVTDVRPAAAPR